MKYVDLVNVQMGTDSVPSFSAGNILPVTGLPFGMTSFALETRGKTHNLFFNPNDHTTTGIRLTHLPSPWIGDYCNITMMPQTGDAVDLTEGCKSGYRRSEAVMKPYELDVTFQRYRAYMELVPTARGAMSKVVFEQADVTQRLALHLGKDKAEITIDPDAKTVSGYVSSHWWEVPENFRQFFVIQFDRTFDLEGTVAGTDDGAKKEQALTYSGQNLVLNLAFEQDGNRELTFTLATSFVSLNQAQENAKQDLMGKTMCTLKREAIDLWEAHLSKIEIDTPDMDQMKTFYTCLYRMFLFPRMFFEYDADGKMIHYSPADGHIYDGPMYTDNGFWDTYKTVYPLFSIILSDRYAQMCEGFLNYYKEAGWLPRWMSPGALDCMPGTAIDAVFADAVAKGVVTDEEQIRLMLEAMMKHSNIPGDKPQFGREGVEDYVKYHYVPSNHKESVNKTQDYCYGDFSIAVIARHLGMLDICREYMDRGQYYRNLFDKETTFMRAKDENGRMREDWTQYDWGWDYTEGGPWQNSFAVFQDMAGLASLMGGREAMIAKMDQLFNTPPHYRCFGYNTEIHEMTEMAAIDFGQCALSNQPSFHIPYIYSMMGNRDKTAYWVRKALRELYSYREDGLPGDEDNGSMAGWYVFSTMGFYPVCPSVAEYVLGSPAVKRCVIHTDCGTDYVIEAPNNTKERVYIQSAEENGKVLERNYLNHADIKKGGTLCFEMTAYPTGKLVGEDGLPYSISTHEKG